MQKGISSQSVKNDLLISKDKTQNVQRSITNITVWVRIKCKEAFTGETVFWWGRG